MAWNEHDQRLLEAHEQRLERLELKKATLGSSADVSVDIDLEQARSNVDALRAAKRVAVPPTPDVVRAVRRQVGDFDLAALFIQGVQINARVTELEEENKEQTKEIRTLKRRSDDQLTNQGVAQQWRLDVEPLIRLIPKLVTDWATERKQRLFGQWLNRAIMFGMGLLFDLSVRHHGGTLADLGAALLEVSIAALIIVAIVRALVWMRSRGGI